MGDLTLVSDVIQVVEVKSVTSLLPDDRMSYSDAPFPLDLKTLT